MLARFVPPPSKTTRRPLLTRLLLCFQFTPSGPGGRVTVRTQLIYPSPLEPLGSESTAVVSELTTPAAQRRDGPGNEDDEKDEKDGIALQAMNGHPNGDVPPPSLLPAGTNIESDMEEGKGLSAQRLKGHDKAMQTQMSNNLNNLRPKSQKGQRTIVVRIEVHDTGVGIKPRDMIDNRVCGVMVVLVWLTLKWSVRFIALQSLCPD